MPIQRRTVGIEAELTSKRQTQGRITIPTEEGFFSSCITLPKGSLYDQIFGLGFRRIHGRGKKAENVFSFPWSRIIEVRRLKDGKVLRRNWDLCPRCRRISSDDDPRKPRRNLCRFCGKSFSRDDNKRACIPFTD